MWLESRIDLGKDRSDKVRDPLPYSSGPFPGHPSNLCASFPYTRTASSWGCCQNHSDNNYLTGLFQESNEFMYRKRLAKHMTQQEPSANVRPPPTSSPTPHNSALWRPVLRLEGQHRSPPLGFRKQRTLVSEVGSYSSPLDQELWKRVPFLLGQSRDPACCRGQVLALLPASCVKLTPSSSTAKWQSLLLGTPWGFMWGMHETRRAKQELMQRGFTGDMRETHLPIRTLTCISDKGEPARSNHPPWCAPLSHLESLQPPTQMSSPPVSSRYLSRILRTTPSYIADQGLKGIPPQNNHY